ncbi:hypothetical protein [Micromonospora radicis]|uniref:hypothetical protein n=1 Tax=Micromonospora radicis TaxID=1894971 RepID=UPI001314573D|nr:hypothetical protein [Micromonospora radicis]
MNRIRSSALALTCASVLALTACGGDGTAAPTPSATPTTAPATTAAAPSATPSAAPATSAPTADAAGDKKLCQALKKAGNDSKQALVSALRSGKEPTPALFAKVYTDMAKELGKVAGSGSPDSRVVTAVAEFRAQVTEAAAAADPAAASEKPAFQKTGANVTAACEPTGVDVNF